MITPASAVAAIASTNTNTKFRWMPGSGAGPLDQEADPVGLVPVARAEVAGGVGADREERHVAQVEQAGEADDDVEPERHADVGGGEHEVAHHAPGRLQEQRQHRRGEHGEPGGMCRDVRHQRKAYSLVTQNGLERSPQRPDTRRDRRDRLSPHGHRSITGSMASRHLTAAFVALVAAWAPAGAARRPSARSRSRRSTARARPRSSCAASPA